MNSVFILTYGCTLNKSDSECLLGQLRKEGFELADSIESADLVIVNSCVVKQLAETKFFRMLRKLKKLNKKVVIAGCIPQARKELIQTKLKDYSIIGIEMLDQVCFVVEETLNGNVVQLIGTKPVDRTQSKNVLGSMSVGSSHDLFNSNDDRLNLPKVRKNKIIEIIPISKGCVGNCSYCKTKAARGELFSYDSKAIIRRAKDAITAGCKEIWITSQDCGAYGVDIGTNIVELLSELIRLEGDFKIRVGMSNPNFIKEFLPGLKDIFQSEKMFKFIHIPVQAGSDRILNLMNRKYSRLDFLQIVKELRSAVPTMTIATDIICGFPTETESEFQESLDLIKITKPEIINISRFWSRPGTPAAELKQLAGTITNTRSRKIANLFKKISKDYLVKLVGSTQEIIVDGIGKSTESVVSFIGHNESYTQVIVNQKKLQKNKLQLGDLVKVKITSSSSHYLIGEII